MRIFLDVHKKFILLLIVIFCIQLLTGCRYVYVKPTSETGTNFDLQKSTHDNIVQVTPVIEEETVLPQVYASEYISTPTPTPTPTPRSRPTIKIIQSTRDAMAPSIRNFEIIGKNLSDGSTAEIFDSSNKIVARYGLKGNNPNKKTLSISSRVYSSGTYRLRIKNSDGQLSNIATFKIIDDASTLSQEATKVSTCSATATPMAKVLYLGGGNCEKLFSRYLQQNSSVENQVPYSLKIKFYEKQKDELILQKIELEPLARAFVESRKDFFEKIRKLLAGKEAEFSASLAETAAKEGADYLQCPRGI